MALDETWTFRPDPELGELTAADESLRELVLREVADGITVQDSSGRLVFANDPAARLIGFPSADALLATPVEEVMQRFELYDAEGEPFPIDRLPGRRALAGVEGAEETIRYRIQETGAERWSLVRATPVFGPDGRVELAINVFRDVTERRLTERNLALLAEAGETLAASLDYELTLTQVARLAVPRISDWCTVYILEPDGTVQRLAVEHFGGRHAEIAGRLEDFPFDPNAEIGVPAVIRSGRPQLHAEATGALVASDLIGGERLASEIDDIGIRSWMCVPLTARGRTFGAISFFSAESGRRFGQPELVLAEELARRAALAVDNALLYAEAQATAEERRRRGETLRFLADASAVLSSSLDYEGTLAAVADLAVPTLADWCIVDTLEPDGSLHRVAGSHVDPGKVELVRTVEGPHGYRRIVHEGLPVLFAEVDERMMREAARSSEHLEQLHRLAPRALICVPLVSRGRTLGAITLASAESGSAYGEPELVLAEELASRAALAIDNARLFEQAQSAFESERRARREAQVAAERLRRLQTVADAALTYLGLDELLSELLERIRGLLEADVATVLLVDAGSGELVARAAQGLDLDAEREVSIPLGRGFSGRVAAERRTLAVDAEEVEVMSPALHQQGVKSLLGAPLRIQERVTGVIHVGTLRRRAFSEDDATLLQLVADRCAIAIEQARLYEEAEEARRQAEARAQASQALEFVGDGIFLLDRTGFVRLWNPAAESITGIPAESVVGRPADRAIPGWAELASRAPIVPAGEAVARPDTLPLELGGRELWLSISGVGFPEGTVFAFRDVTEERGLEKLKSDFVSTVSHELRTPLAAIYGAALTLRREDLPLEPSQQSDLLGVIANESERLARTVNDILWTSRIETGGLQVTITASDPHELVNGVVQSARLHLPPGIALELAAPDDLPELAVDPDKARQVLSNLVENAIKYSPDGGKVKVRLEPWPGAVRFVVSDEGLGIPLTERERIFEKFYRLDPGLTRGVSGTGLGLYICRELVGRMGGRIWVDPDAARGSTFVVELPTLG